MSGMQVHPDHVQVMFRLLRSLGELPRTYAKTNHFTGISTCESSVYGYRSLMRSLAQIKAKVTSRSK